MASGSEQISTRWIEGAVRECRRCSAPIKNMARDVGEVRTLYPSNKREILCMTCHMTRSQWLGSKTPPLYVDSDWIMPESPVKPVS
jgi:hypothetical protein